MPKVLPSCCQPDLSSGTVSPGRCGQWAQQPLSLCLHGAPRLKVPRAASLYGTPRASPWGETALPRVEVRAEVLGELGPLDWGPPCSQCSFLACRSFSAKQESPPGAGEVAWRAPCCPRCSPVFLEYWSRLAGRAGPPCQHGSCYGLCPAGPQPTRIADPAGGQG